MAFDGTAEDEILRLAAIAEKYSEHPLARSVMKCAKDKGIDAPDPNEFEIQAGMGVAAQWNGGRILVGKDKFLEDKGICLGEDVGRAVSEQVEQGRTAILVADDTRVAGLIAIADEIRAETPGAIARLKAMGIRNIAMLTGDNNEVAKAVAEEIGVDSFQADLLPEQKLQFVERLQEQGRLVGMIGDGINDAPALALADVGIAMGAAGTDVAVETADVTLMNDDLSGVVDFMGMSKKVLLRIKLNIFFSIIYNVIGLVLASFGMLTPVVAVIFQEAGCITVVFSSTLLLWSRTGPVLKGTDGEGMSAIPLTVDGATRDNISQCAQ
jgi:Cd2+/Zn2+-exporting ATPase